MLQIRRFNKLRSLLGVSVLKRSIKMRYRRLMRIWGFIATIIFFLFNVILEPINHNHFQIISQFRTELFSPSDHLLLLSRCTFFGTVLWCNLAPLLQSPAIDVNNEHRQTIVLHIRWPRIYDRHNLVVIMQSLNRDCSFRKNIFHPQ